MFNIRLRDEDGTAWLNVIDDENYGWTEDRSEATVLQTREDAEKWNTKTTEHLARMQREGSTKIIELTN